MTSPQAPPQLYDPARYTHNVPAATTGVAMTEKDDEELVPPPGAGLDTVMLAVEVVAMSAAATTALSSVALT